MMAVGVASLVGEAEEGERSSLRAYKSHVSRASKVGQRAEVPCVSDASTYRP